MKRTLLFIAVFTVAFLQCYSQSDLRPGWVILNNNDTLYGSINYRGIKKNFQECEFVENNSSEKSVFNPGDIKAYRFTGDKYYISGYLKKVDTEKRFLEFLFDGIVDIYYIADDMGDHYYMSKANTGLVELKKSTVISTIDNKKYSNEIREYIGILKLFFSDSPESMRKAESTLLNSNSLVRISEDYHNEVCSDQQCVIFSKKKITPVIKVGARAGISISQMEFSSNGMIHYYKMQTTGLNPELGIFVNLKEPSISERMSLQLEAAFGSMKYISGAKQLEITELKIPVLVKYTFPSKKVKASLLGGFMYGRIFDYKEFSQVYGNIENVTGKNQFGLTGGTEISYNFDSGMSLYCQMRYEYLTGRNSYIAFNDLIINVLTHTQTLGFAAGIAF